MIGLLRPASLQKKGVEGIDDSQDHRRHAPSRNQTLDEEDQIFFKPKRKKADLFGRPHDIDIYSSLIIFSLSRPSLRSARRHQCIQDDDFGT